MLKKLLKCVVLIVINCNSLSYGKYILIVSPKIVGENILGAPESSHEWTIVIHYDTAIKKWTAFSDFSDVSGRAFRGRQINDSSEFSIYYSKENFEYTQPILWGVLQFIHDCPSTVLENANYTITNHAGFTSSGMFDMDFINFLKNADNWGRIVEILNLESQKHLLDAKELVGGRAAPKVIQTNALEILNNDLRTLTNKLR